MPKFKDILVQVVVDDLDENGENSCRPLEEWGVQKIRKSKKISAYIEAETGKSFRILIQPKIPFPSEDAPAAHEYNTRQKAKSRENGLNTTNPSFLKTNHDWHDGDRSHSSLRKLDRRGRANSNGVVDARRRSSNSDTSVMIKEEPTDEQMTFSFPAPSMERMSKRTSPPPFHLMACLYLDGRKKPEHRVIVRLNPDADGFNYPSGEVEIKTRWVQTKDGKIKEKSWVFQDIGIETLFDKMLIAEDKNIIPVAQRNEAALVHGCETIHLNGDNDSIKEENSKVGQILVTIDRVTLGKKWQDTNYKAKHKEHETEDVDMVDAGKDITHTAGFAHKKTLSINSEGVTVVDYHKFKDEGHFATFQFFYRSKSILQKFNFTGLPKVVSYVLPSKRSNMAFKTPLSITFSTAKSCATGGKGKIVASDIGKKKIKGQGLFSREGICRNVGRVAGQSRKKEESDSIRNDQSKVEALSSSSLLPGGHSSYKALPPSFLNMQNSTRYNLRSLSNTNKLSLMTSNHAIPFGQNGPNETKCRASSDPCGLTATVSITPSSEAEGGSQKSTGKAGSKSSTATYDFSNIGSTLRDNSNHVRDADEREACDVEAHLKSDTDEDDSQICQNKDDHGLSIGVKKLVLGKRGRESEDRDLGEAGTRAKKVALDATRLRAIPITLLVEKV
ncbi:hypothetical protein MMC27_006378 [Xylographa pallens]|nr:hypothetical protein [Xylographa pallens]